MSEAMLEGARSYGLARSLAVKVLSALVTLAVVLVGNFYLFRVLPADPAKNLTRNSALTARQLAAINRTFGLACRCRCSSGTTWSRPSTATSAGRSSTSSRSRT